MNCQNDFLLFTFPKQQQQQQQHWCLLLHPAYSFEDYVSKNMLRAVVKLYYISEKHFAKRKKKFLQTCSSKVKKNMTSKSIGRVRK